LPGTATTAPPANASATQLLADAQAEYQLAQTALTNHDLAGYQAHINQEQADVQAALAKLGVKTSTTTVPKVTTTTAKP
jgi:hypothetical protein